MKKSFYGFSFIFLVLSVLCGLSLRVTPAQDNQVERGEAVEFKTLAKNSSSEEHEAKNIVIRTQDEWAKLWDTIQANGSPKPELPVVDFDNHMIIAILAGDQPSPGHTVVVLETLKINEKMRVSYKEVKPGANCVHPAVLAQPYHIIETDKAEMVSFNRLQEVKDCLRK